MNAGRARLRSATMLAVSVALVVSSVAGFTPASTAAAPVADSGKTSSRGAADLSALAPALDCATVFSIQGAHPRELRSVDTGANIGTATDVTDFSSIGSGATSNLNALGITADGNRVFGVLPANSGGTGRTIYRLDRAAETVTNVGTGVSGAVTTHGAVNPANGFYYYGGVTDDTLNIYGFNTASNTSIGLVASGTIPNGGGNGDWAFDSQGRLYVVAGDVQNNVVSVINQSIPTTAQSTPLAITATELVTSGVNAAINGVAFGGDGYLYIASGAVIYKINPSSGATVASGSLSQSGSVDLASCAVPSTLELRKNFPDGRVVATDQATLTITGGGLSTGNTGTTVGTDSGPQTEAAETAGPVLALSGTEYTISETGAGTGASYGKTWECVNQTSGASVANGTGTSGTFTMPATSGGRGIAVLCTFTNAIPPRPDFGDAPNTYGTLEAATGARHDVTNYDEANNTAPLMLGTKVDVEADGVPGPDASGDDTAGIDDEDGLGGPLSLNVGTAPTVSVSATNGSNQPATLAGWIDLDRDGTFETGERATASVPANAGAVTRELTFAAPTVEGATYARFRLFPGDVADPQPTGAASAGEVEDHAATIDRGGPVVSCDTDPALFNTAYNGAGGELAPGATDLNWEAGLGNTTGPASVGSWIPAWVTNRATGWALSRFGNADWISYYSNTQHSGSVDIYFRYRFRIAPEVSLESFSLPMNFYADNSVPEVWVNGVAQSQFHTGSLPQSANTYFYEGFVEGRRAKLVLSHSFQHGANTVVVRVGSAGPNQGFMAQVGPSPLCADTGDAPATYGTTKADNGAAHGLTGYDADAHTADLMLGDTIDADVDGQPGTGADGDDTTGSDDEDGVVFNPDVNVGGGVNLVQDGVQNKLAITSSGPGFVSAWVDFNRDGDFADSGERVASDAAVSSGANDLSFTPPVTTAQGASYARVRLTSTAGVITSPGGAAPDGEVEDYAVFIATPVPAGCGVGLINPGFEQPDLDGPTPAVATFSPKIKVYADQNVPGWNDTSSNVEIWGDGASWSDTNGPVPAYQGEQYAEFSGGYYQDIVTTPGVTLHWKFAHRGRTGPDTIRFMLGGSPAAGGTFTPNLSLDRTTGNGGWALYTGSYTVPAGQHVTRLQFRAIASAAGSLGNGNFLDGVQLAVACDDFGDAPRSYSTEETQDGPRHRVTGDLRLGSAVDIDLDGRPSVDAAGDDTADTDDEDGVAFNPDLGYPNPTIRTGSDPITLEPVSNTLEITASDDGFVSAWVDWNIDGDFNDPGERVANAQPVTAGSNDITFSRGENPPDIRTYVRVRYSTDAASIAQPTGPAPDGEVEDYRVLLERLITPAACSPVSEPFYAMTFLSIEPQDGGTNTQNSARYPNVTVVKGEPVDMLVQRTGGNNLNSPGFKRGGDDAAWNLNAGGGMAQIAYTFVKSGTTTPIAVNSIWTINDMDRGEVAQIQRSALAGYAVTPGSQVVITEETSWIRFTGTVSGNGAPESRWQIWFQNQTTFVSRWDGFAFSGFSLDGDNDIPVPKSCDDYGDAPDSYKTVLASDGPHHTITPQLRLGADSEFDGDGQPSATANGDDANRNDDEDGVASQIRMTGGEPTIVEVAATNDTTVPATLAGWLDLDGDGTFELGERVVVPVPASSGSATYSLVFPPGTGTPATAFARFRLFPGVLTDPRPTGAATAGEVEDYPVEVLDRELEITKSSDATADSRPGDTITYTVTAENTGTGDFTADNPARVVDDLSGVLDDADFNDDASADLGDDPTYGAPRLLWTGALPAGETVTITYTVTLKGGGDGDVDNVAWAPAIGDPPGPTPDCLSGPVAPPAQPLGTELLVNGDFTNGGPNGQAVAPPWLFQGSGAVQWSSPFQQPNGVVGPTIAFHPGDAGTANGSIRQVVEGLQVGGTFRLRGRVGLIASANNGSGSTQQMTVQVLDGDGTVIATQAVTVPFATGTTWPSAGMVDLSFVAPTDEVTVRFTDTSSGPSFSLNVDMLFDDATLVQTAEAGPSTVPCAKEQYDLPKLTIVKRSNRTDLPADGEQLIFTVTVTNEGPGVYTAAAPATFTDDLSEVLDDADFDAGSITASSGSASFDPATGELTWSGPLAADASATISYSVTYDEDKPGGDQQLDNAACVPEEEALNAGQACITVRVPGSGLEQSKRSNPASGTSVDVGDEITYTLTFTNTGPAPASVDTTDDLSGVLDDAELVSGPTADAGLTVTPGAGDTFAITGTVPVDDALTVTYRVRVKAFGAQGDHTLGNVLACQPGDSADCVPETTEHEVRRLRIAKTSDATVDSRPGDPVTYTVAVENIGTGDYTAAEPATLVDDLSGVLDDADYQDDATSDVGDAPTYAAPRVRWSGPLAAGQTATITYTVVLAGGGDGHVDNVAWSPDPGDPPGPTPDCEDPGTTVPCDGEQFDLPKLSVTKTADPTEVHAVGDVVTYTVVVKNEGPGDYTVSDPASLSDDLSDVLDDATYVAGSESADVGTASYADPTLSWSGALAAGDEATISYQVRYTGEGDQSLRNAACVPRVEALEESASCDAVTVDGPHLVQTKTSNPDDGTIVEVGDEISYTLTFANDGKAAAAVDTTDDLSDVLDDAQLVSGPTALPGLTADRVGDVLEITGSVPAGETRTVTYTVRVTEPDTGDGVLSNVLACQPGEPPTCDPETTEHPVRDLEITKASSATGATRQGDTVTYTITAENIGGGDYTAADPARVVDDLTAVLDDADFNDDASADVGDDPTYDEPRLTWSGALAAGEVVTITYTVDLKAGGDGVVRNVAWAPDPGDPPGPTPDCDDPDTTVPCDVERYDLPRLSVSKSASHTELPALGETMTYTVVVTNEGPGDYTAGAPATFADDLSDVLDDASFVTGSATADVGTAAFNDPSLSWSGVLASGEDATITYQVQYTGDGDHRLDNSACVPANEAADPDEACDVVKVPGSDLSWTKTSDPADGASVDVGDEVTYTLTFTNDGEAAGTVDTTDDLSGVLDDAALVDGPTAQSGLTVDRVGDVLEIGGSVPGGASRTVTYTVEVLPFGEQDDHRLRNALACNVGAVSTCEPEVTEHPVRRLRITKASDATVDARPGDEIAYTVTAENVGTGDYTDTDPATVTDDLAGVLDDADFNDDAAADLGDDPTYDEPRLTWSGALAAGEVVTITYTVTLKGGGDGAVDNVAWATDPGKPVGPTPDCDDPASNVPCGGEEFDLPKLSIAKTSDLDEVSAVGDVVTYTVTVTNNGPGDYTAADPASFTDDLSEVLDDASYVAGSESADVGTASYAEPELSWTGALAAGEDATISYQVRYTGAGDTSLVNTACVPEDDAKEPADDCTTVTVPGSRLSHEKSVDPDSGTAVEVGRVLTYTLTFANTGEAPATVDTTDDLAGVLDDAELVAGSINAGNGLSAVLNGQSLEITGTVPKTATRTVTYQVRVLPFADQGDHELRNALACEPGEPRPCEPEVTTNPVRHLRVTKTSGTRAVDTGDRMSYVVRVHNDGAGDYTDADPASVVDDLSDVIDDALFDVDDVEVSGGSVEYDAPELTWTGALPTGATVVITYTVLVTNQGDHDLVNTVSGVGCPAGDPACAPPPIQTLLPHVVPAKSADPAAGTNLAAGDLVTYTLRWTNDGQADGVVDATDDLSGVLDDAELVTGPTSSSPAVDATLTGDELRVVGPIAAGDVVTVVYQVRVLADADRADDRLENVLTPDTPQVECGNGSCEPVEPPTTVHLIGALEDWKTAAPRRRKVQAGDRVTYTLHFANSGAAPVDVNRDDVMTRVLDDAVLVSRPRSSDPALTVSRVVAGRFTVTGIVAPDQTVTVSYAVRVKPRAKQGDRNLANFLVEEGQQPPRGCQAAGSRRAAGEATDCTSHQVRRYDLSVDKRTVTRGSVGVGDAVKYRIVVSNKGPDASSGRIKVVDKLPRGLDLRSAHGKGWDCSVRQDTNTATCVRTKALAPDRAAPRIVVVATVKASAAGGRVVNTAEVNGVSDSNANNNDDAAVLSIDEIPPLPGTGFRHALRFWSV